MGFISIYFDLYPIIFGYGRWKYVIIFIIINMGVDLVGYYKS